MNLNTHSAGIAKEF